MSLRKAALVRDRQISAQIKQLDRSIRKLARKGDTGAVAELTKVRRGLLDTTQQNEADLAFSYAPTSTEWLAAQDEAARRAYASQYVEEDRRATDRIRDRAIGAMLGLAVGEAIGVTVDGWARESFREIGDMHGGGRLDLQPGQWGGDTAMALALMESLIWRRELDETDFIERLLEWQDDGVFSCTSTCLGIDDNTREALARYRVTDNPIAGDCHPDNISSGSMVRLGPVAIRYWFDRIALRDAVMRQSRVTHAGPAQIEACLAFAEVLADAIRGASRMTVFGQRYVPSASSVDIIMMASWKDRSRDAIRSDATVLSALETAMWCVDRSETFDEAVLLAVNLGEDAARITALVGLLAGGFFGASTIRPAWLERLAWRDHLTEQVDALLKVSRPPKRRSG